MTHINKLNKNIHRIANVDYVESKREENNNLLNSIMQCLATASSSNTFDLYTQKTFLDNVLRGGFPITLDKEKSEILYVYSRKHGDLERDYNKFVTYPTYFSQGDGNYRDINQNRRNDIFFNPQLRDANIKTFFNLIQLDGFNPLVVKGLKYCIKDKAVIGSIVNRYVQKDSKSALRSFLSKSFYIGELFMFIDEKNIAIKDKQ